jgi:flagellar biosynthetic protein FliP
LYWGSPSFVAALALYAQQVPIPRVDFNITQAKNPQQVALSLQISAAADDSCHWHPAIILMLTSFTKIIIVFDFMKRALSLQNMPPNQVMVSLALFMSHSLLWRPHLTR